MRRKQDYNFLIHLYHLNSKFINLIMNLLLLHIIDLPLYNLVC